MSSSFMRRFIRNIVFTLIVFSSPTIAQNENSDAWARANSMINDQSTSARLKSLLGVEYQPLMQDLEHLAVPAKLKNDGIYIEGWRENYPTQHTSALVMYPDGRIYAAYYDVENGAIRYFSNDKTGKLHPAIEIWLKRLAPPVEVVTRPNQAAIAPEVPSNSTTLAGAGQSAPSADDQAALRSVAASIWGASLANNWTMNAEVGDLLSQATGDILRCSQAFSLVPKPVGFVPGWSYLAKSALPVVQYILGVKQNRTYQICVSTVALNYRSAVEMASAGI